MIVFERDFRRAPASDRDMTNKDNASLPPDIRFQLVRKIECHKIIGLGGYELAAHESKYLEFHRLSGVILFERNVESLAQVASLIAEVHEKLVRDNLVPLVMADHEGDLVSELRRLIGVPPSAMAVAATGDTGLAYDVARETAEAMAKLGVNVVLAPVADCFLNARSAVSGLRTFGRDPERVAEFVRATVKGYREGGVLCCVKHFPGHGATSDDSHEILPHVDRSVDELRRVDLVPFRAALGAGADMVMTAHVAFSLGEEGKRTVPASFDAQLVDKVLRDEMGFEGVVITDALEMEGARAYARSAYGGLAGGFERTLLAGSDLLLYASAVPERMRVDKDGEPMIAVEVMQTIIETLERVVDRGRIDRKMEDAAKQNEGLRNLLEILDRSEARVTRLRERATELRLPPLPRAEGKVIHLEDYATMPAIYKTVAESSIVVVRDPESFIPAARDTAWHLLPVEHVPGRSLKRQDLSGFLSGLCRHFPGWKVARPLIGFRMDTSGARQAVFYTPSQKELIEGKILYPGLDLVRLPEGSPCIPVVSFRGTPPETYLDLLSQWVEERVVPFVLVTGWPVYEWVPESVGCMLTLGASSPVGSAAAAVLSGELTARGTLKGLF
jgi:beta-glucosidase-like glycosyl hydrolase